MSQCHGEAHRNAYIDSCGLCLHKEGPPRHIPAVNQSRRTGLPVTVRYSAAVARDLNAIATEVFEDDGFFRFSGGAAKPWRIDLLLPDDVDEVEDAGMLATLRAMVRP